MPKPGSAEARGYGSPHQKARARWAPLVEAGGVCCCRCGRPIVAGKILQPNGAWVSNWHLDHSEDRMTYRGAAHRRCNVSAGALKGNRSPKRRAARQRKRVFAQLVGSRKW